MKLLGTVVRRIVLTLVAGFLVLPLVVVVMYSVMPGLQLDVHPGGLTMRWYREFVDSSSWRHAVLLSLTLGCLVTVVSVTVGLLVALALVRFIRRGGRLVRALCLAPVIVPTIITGMAVLFAYEKMGLVFTNRGLLVAHVVLTIPYAVIVLEMAVAQIDPDLERAAVSLGASRPRAFLRVALPLVLPAIIAAAVFVFYNSWEEVVVTSFLAGVDNTTLPLQIFQSVLNEVSPVIAAVSSLIMIATFVCGLVYLLGRRFLRKKRGT